MKNNLPTHEEIAQRAREIWQGHGNPGGRDDEMWLQAERELIAASGGSPADSESRAPDTTSESKGAGALAERIKSETAAESRVEYAISPTIPDEAAIQAALQKKDARAPHVPTKTAPKAKPAETGKPLWNTPHSS